MSTLVDTSAWVEYLRDTISEICKTVDRMIESDQADGHDGHRDHGAAFRRGHLRHQGEIVAVSSLRLHAA
ncbi:MAG: hypothetical protein ACRDX9_11150 [Acidimicrobiia bacterium]